MKENNKALQNLSASENGGIVVNFPEGQTEATLRVLHGEIPDELPAKEDLIANYSGTIGTPVEFLSKRIDAEQFEPRNCVVLIDRDKIRITLVINERDPRRRAEIKGELTLNPKFIKFGINQDTPWEPNDLGQYFKMNRAYFPNNDENVKLVSILRSFEADVATRYEKETKENGSFKNNFSGVVTTLLPETFRLKIPVFKGAAAEDIEVEFYANVNGRDVSIKLFSPGAVTILEDMRDAIIDNEIEEIKKIAPGIAIFEV